MARDTCFESLDVIQGRPFDSSRGFQVPLCRSETALGARSLPLCDLDFDACGIEIECDLVDAAQELADEHELPVEFVCGSFIPVGGEDVADHVGDFAWLRTDAPSAYDELGLDPQDFDVIFAYPWPGEEDTVIELFDRYAAVGALLVTYQGRDDVHVRRKVRRKR